MSEQVPQNSTQGGNGYPVAGSPGQAYPGAGQPGAAYPGHAYPGAAYPGHGAPGAPIPPKRPKLVDSSFGLLMLALVLTVLSVPAGILLANSAGNTVTAAGVVLLILLGIICLGVTLVAALFIRKGHSWARILLAVYAGLSVVSFFTGTNLLGWWGILVLIAATVMLFRKPSAAYFKEMAQYRQSGSSAGAINGPAL